MRVVSTIVMPISNIGSMRTLGVILVLILLVSIVAPQGIFTSILNAYATDIAPADVQQANLVTDSTKPTIAIMAPPNGAILKGPTTGLALDINGFAEDFGSGVSKVEIRTISPNGYKSPYSVALYKSIGDWPSWSSFRMLIQSGVYTITARAQDNAGNFNWHTIKITVELTESPPDFTTPIVKIASPVDGQTVDGELVSGLVVYILGTASDSNSGIQKVEVRWFKGTQRSSYVLATPDSPGDWSSWNQNRLLSSPGTYNLIVKATDRVGNSQWSNITIHVQLT